jgi:hypothetical protein
MKSIIAWLLLSIFLISLTVAVGPTLTYADRRVPAGMDDPLPPPPPPPDST